MADIKIKKILEAGKLVYPATILDAVKDATPMIKDANGNDIANPNKGKTLREIITENEKVTAEALNSLDARIATLEKAPTSTVTAEKIAAWDKAVTDAAQGISDAAAAKTQADKGVADAAAADQKAVNAQNDADAAQASANSALEKIGDSTKGLTKALADEVTRATTKEGELNTAISNEETARKNQIGEIGDVTVKSYVDTAISGVNGAATTLAGRVSANETAIENITKDKGVIDVKVEALKKEIMTGGAEGSVKQAYDTLKEIADFLDANDQLSDSGTIVTAINANTTAIGDENGGLVKDVADLKAVGSTKVEAVAKSGSIKINGTEVQIVADNTVTDANYKHITVTDSSVSDGTTTFSKYVHPTTTGASAAAVKVGKDSEGHVVIGAALSAGDIAATVIEGDDSKVAVAGVTVAAQIDSLAQSVKAASSSALVVDATPGDGKISIGGTEYTVYTEAANTVHDASYSHITVSATNGVSDAAGNVYKYEAPAGTVVDSDYSHITVTASSVKDAAGNEMKTTAIAADATGIASAAAVYTFAVSAVAASDTNDYDDVF